MEKKELYIKQEDEYGPKFKDHLFEQYKLYITSAEKISDRRQSANNYFIAINTAFISLIGLFIKFEIPVDQGWIKLIFAIVGILICVIFWFLIRSYRQLNSGKFTIIHEIERFLPVALYKHEWYLLDRGRNIKVYYPFSHIENFIPWIFGLIYLLIGVITFF